MNDKISLLLEWVKELLSRWHTVSTDGSESDESKDSENAENDECESENSENAEADGSESEDSENAEADGGGSEKSENAETGESGAEDSENAEADGSGSEESENAEADGSESEKSENAEADGSESEKSENAEADGSGSEKSENAEADGSESEDSENAEDGEPEDWEKEASQSAEVLKQMNQPKVQKQKTPKTVSPSEFERKEKRNETGHRTGVSSYKFSGNPELDAVYRKASRLLEHFTNEMLISERVAGNAHWDAITIAKDSVTYHQTRIPSAKYSHPQKEPNVVLLLDISGSCASQAEMFMAIAAGCIGPNVACYLSFNGVAYDKPLEVPPRKPRFYMQAKSWVNQELQNVISSNPDELPFKEFVLSVEPKTIIVFGDFDGIDLYQEVINDTKFRNVEIFWFANENSSRGVPKGFTKKNYVSDIFEPKDFLRALKRIRH